MKIAFYMKSTKTYNIKEQRDLLYSYIRTTKALAGEVAEYTEEMGAGEGPEWTRLLSDAGSGRIDVILVAEFAVLGNRAFINDSVTKLFPFLGVRFVSVTDSFDSEKTDVPHAWRRDMKKQDYVKAVYEEALSRKKRAAHEKAWSQGRSTGAHAPFGYVKDEKNPGRWKIDPEAAKIVRYLFDLALQGFNTTQIAHRLNDEKIPTPMVYNETHKNWKEHAFPTKEKGRLWTAATVAPYLKRYEYTGAMVIGRKSPVTPGSKDARERPKEEWKVAEGVNEGIVTAAEFEKAGQVIRSRKNPKFGGSRDYVLKGKVRCASCGLCMDYVDGVKEPYYVCGRRAAAGAASLCSPQKHIGVELEQEVLTLLKQHAGESEGSVPKQPGIFSTNKLTRELVDAWIADIYVHGDGKLEIVWQ